MSGKLKWFLATAALAAVAFCWVKFGAPGRAAKDVSAQRPAGVADGADHGVARRSQDRVDVVPENVRADQLKVHQVLSAQGSSNEQKLDELIRVLPDLGAEEQVDVAAHVTNLCEDDQANRLIPLMQNRALVFQARQDLFDGLFNRDPAVSLPLLLKLAEGKDKIAEQARQSMQQLLGEDHGTDLSAWRKAVDEELEKYKTSEPEAGR